jgi:FkbM family methyltransferase
VPKHHKVFSRFKPCPGPFSTEQLYDRFLGTMTRHEFYAGMAWARLVRKQPDVPAYPPFDEEYFEWIDVLESVVAARKSYTMIELGAGTGRWAVRAASALRQHNPKLPFRLIAVEAEPVHFEWMRLHFADNGIDPDRHSLIYGALSETPGEVSFYVSNETGNIEANGWYGQRLTKDYEVDVLVEEAPYAKHQIRRHASGAKSITVPAITLASILDGLSEIDLIDSDIQGMELPVICSSIHELDAKVKRLHIGTHGAKIEAELRQLLTSHGWRCLADYAAKSLEQTPWGPIQFQDGAQSWVNPRLSGSWWAGYWWSPSVLAARLRAQAARRRG